MCLKQNKSLATAIRKNDVPHPGEHRWRAPDCIEPGRGKQSGQSKEDVP